MRFVRLAYVEKNISTVDRLYYSWCAVFIVRIWLASLEKASAANAEQILSTSFPSKSFNNISKRNLFITMPTLFSIELNAHSLTYLLTLLVEKQITEEAVQIIFNSQVCESYFRAARSMSGAFSSVVNFTVNEFLQRASKLKTLEEIKFNAEQNRNNLIFPKHRKLWKQTNPSFVTYATSMITEKTIDETIGSAYLEANRILRDCNLSILNPLGQMISFDEVNRIAFEKLSRSQQKMSNDQSFQWPNDSQMSSDDDYDDDDDNESNILLTRNDQSYDSDDTIDDDDSSSYNISNISSSTIRGMRVFDSINDNRSDSFFRLKINNQEKFMHKQSATWYFSKDKVKLSADRLKRVQSQK